jgi:hypothetical protein
MELPLRLVAADPLCEGRGRVSPTTARPARRLARVSSGRPRPAHPRRLGDDGLDARERRAAGRTEADHIIGNLLRRRRGTADGYGSLIQIAYVAIKAAEARATRELRAEGA